MVYNKRGDFMKYFELCEMSRLVAKELMESELFQELMACKKEIDCLYQKEIFDFKKYEAKYEEVKEYGKYHPDYNKYKDAFLKAKDTLFGLDLVKRYKELERKFQIELQLVSEEIKKSIKS